MTRKGLDALGAFFAFGAGASGLSAITLLWPGGPLDVVWRVNPDGHAGLLRAGAWGVLLMLVVCAVCAATARGLWARQPWGRTLAIAMLAVNLLSDLANAVVRGDLRTLIGVPIAALLIAYLLAPRTREVFQHGGVVRGLPTQMIERFLFDADVRAEQTWQLLRSLHARGVSEFTLTFVGLKGQASPFTDALLVQLAPFKLPSAEREHASARRADEVVRETELWRLTQATIELLAEVFDHGLFTYPAGEWDVGCVEAPTFYREGQMVLGIVTHEREGVLRLSEQEHREIASVGIPTRATSEWI